MTQEERFRNLFSNVSHIKIGEYVSEETIKSLAIAAKSVENRKQMFQSEIDRLLTEV